MIQVSVVPPAAAHPDPHGRDLESLLRSQPDGRLVTSLGALAGSPAQADLHGARRVVARLGTIDFEVAADVRAVAAESVFEIRWTPVTAVVDLMLDWDLLELEIALPELAEWLGVGTDVASRALDRLGSYPGVTVQRSPGDADAVQVWLDVDECPLTAERCAAPAPA